MARTQAPDLAGPEAIRVPNAVTDFYAPPPRPVNDPTLADVANALSGFNTELRRYSTTQAKGNGDAEVAAANKWIAGATADDWNKAERSGTIPAYSNPVANAVIQKDYGRRLGVDMQTRVNAAVDGGGIDLLAPDANIDQIVSQGAQEAIKQLNAAGFSNSRYAAAALAEHTTALRDSLIKKQAELRVKTNLDERLGVVQNSFTDFIAQGDKDGKLPNGFVPPEVGNQVQDKIRAAYGELGKSLNLPPAWMDKKLLDVLKNSAKDHPEIVWQVLNAERKDEKTGETIKPISSKYQYAKDVQEIIDTVRPALGKKVDTAAFNDQVIAGQDALNKQDGSWWQIKDHSYKNPITGEQKTISAETVRKETLARYQAFSDQETAKRGERADMKFDREFAVYSSANQPNPVWKSTLEGAATALSSPSALSNPAERQRLGAAGELYLNMSAKNYSYLKNTIDLKGPSQNYFDVYEVARRYMGLNQDQATDMAARAVNQRESASDLNVQAAQRKLIDQKVRSEFAAGTFSWLTGSGSTNTAESQKRMTEIASVLVRVNGISTEDAVKSAAQLLKDRSFVINGHAVVDQGYMPPKELQQNVGVALQQFFDKHGVENGVDSPSDLTISPNGDGSFQIMKKNGTFQVPVYAREGDNAVPAVIQMRDLYQLKAKGEQDAHEAIIKKQAEAPSKKAAEDALRNRPPVTDFQKQRERALERNSLIQKQRQEDNKARDAQVESLRQSLNSVASRVGNILGQYNPLSPINLNKAFSGAKESARKLREEDQARPSSID